MKKNRNFAFKDGSVERANVSAHASTHPERQTVVYRGLSNPIVWLGGCPFVHPTASPFISLSYVQN